MTISILIRIWWRWPLFICHRTVPKQTVGLEASPAGCSESSSRQRYPSEIIRPFIVSLGVFIVLATHPISHPIAKLFPSLKKTAWLADVAFFAVSLWVFWEYHLAVTELEEGLFALTLRHPLIALTGCAVFAILCWRVWGAALSVTGILVLVYFYTGQYWPWIFETAPAEFIDSAEDLWFNLNDGVLGNLMGILIFTVLPFVLLGITLQQTGGGRSMIKIAYHLTENFRGGPAHAAIAASGLFGTISGGSVTNVVATGVITIPMIKRRGFSSAFAFLYQHAASSAGQITPPIMGAAALVMSDLTGISYLTIIIAAIVPALAYYISLFTAVVFEARRLGVEATPDPSMAEEMKVVGQDYRNLLLVFLPICVVVVALLFGFSASGAGMFALYTLIPLSFLNPEIRKNPMMLLMALARGGRTFSELMMAIGVVGIIIAILGATGLPNDFAQVLNEMAGSNLVVVLLIAAAAALMLGMGMPTVPAYLSIILIMGPALQNFGLSVLVSHLFVLYYGVASSIVPPVAVAAYAAASIAESAPFTTAIYALRIGLVKFVVPFAFVYYPVLLIVEEGGVKFDMADFLSASVRVLMLIYLFSSATLAFDRRHLAPLEIVVRLALGIGALMVSPTIHWTAFTLGLALIAWHYYRTSK
ncbi:MAG: TRAP transporter fused permease subunit [Proteobacteria bacterium]|nr:TRAP transporter fused permease subunit [Pseudomonadota bacterium]